MYLNRHHAAATVRSALQNVSPRRTLTWSLYALGFTGLRSLVGAARSLDDVLFPDWAEQEVRAPVFIFANGRSGTTLMHRLMSLDSSTFAGLRLHESVFSAVTIQWLLATLGEGPLAALTEQINTLFFDGNTWRGIHAMGIDKMEEDEATFVYAFESPAVSLLNPFMEHTETLGWLDGHDKRRREQFMDFYEATVKRHLYATGGDRRFLNKNIFFAPRVRTMLSRFPDARFIYLIRHPYESLPSFMSMFYEKWRTHSPEIPRHSKMARDVMRMGYAYYRTGAQLAAELPAERLHVVRYEDLARSPVKVVEELYAWMGESLSTGYRKRLEQATAAQTQHVSAHHYSLEQFGLTRDEVYAELSDVFEQFGFER